MFGSKPMENPEFSCLKNSSFDGDPDKDPKAWHNNKMYLDSLESSAICGVPIPICNHLIILPSPSSYSVIQSITPLDYARRKNLSSKDRIAIINELSKNLATCHTRDKFEASNSKDLRVFSQFVYWVRSEWQLTQAEAANRCGMSQSHFSYIERNRIIPSTEDRLMIIISISKYAQFKHFLQRLKSKTIK